MANLTNRVVSAGVILLFALGLCRAAKFKFQDKEDAVRKEARQQRGAPEARELPDAPAGAIAE